MDNAIESSSSNASVLHDIMPAHPPESKPMSINITQTKLRAKFHWVIYKYTIKQLNINAEYKALRHFNKYARPGSKIYIKYLRNLYGIMPYFNEKVYMEYANLNLNITLEQLYYYFRKEGYKKYPLNDEYDRLFYNIDSVFDVDIYHKRYMNNIENYLYSDDNYDASSDDWETSSQISSISSISNVSTASMATVQTRNSMLSTLISNANNHRRGNVESHEHRETQTIQNEYNNWKENLYNWYPIPDSLNKKIYKFYNENKDEYPLDDKYFLLKYNITDPLFNLNLYCKINNITYNMSNINELDNIYLLFSKNNKLDDNYYKTYYNIPDELDLNTFMIRYDTYFENKRDYLRVLNQEQKNYIYMVFNKLCESDNFSYLDNYYYRILYNIPEDLNYNIYISRYPDIIIDITKQNLQNTNNYVQISKEEKYLYENIEKYITQYTLDDDYYRLLYKIPEELDYFIFIEYYTDVVEINDLKTKNIISELSEFVRDSILLDNKKILYKFYNSNRDKYTFTDDYLKQYYYALYNIPEKINETVYINMYNDLKQNILNIDITNKNSYYQLYYEFLHNKLENNGLNEDYNTELDKYYRLYYNIPDDFVCDLYLQIYTSLHDKINFECNDTNKQIYELANFDNMPLNDSYYRLKYNIPELLDPLTYAKRYPDIQDELIDLEPNTLEYNKKIYDLCQTLLVYFKLDDKYFIIKYNISLLFHSSSIEIFKDKYNIVYTKEYDNQYHAFGEEGQKYIDLTGDKYLQILFNLDDEFNWNEYYNNNKEFIDNNNLDIELDMNEDIINKVKCFCYYSIQDTNVLNYINNYKTIKSITDKKIQYDIDKGFDYLKYSNEHVYFYMHTRIKITPEFVYMFYNNQITLENIYNLFKHNIPHENIEITEINEKTNIIENKFIENYEYLTTSTIYKKYYKDFFVLNEYINNIGCITNKQYIKHDVSVQINTQKFLPSNQYFNLYTKLYYNTVLTKFQQDKITFSNTTSDLDIAYVYHSYNANDLDVINFIHSLQYIPKNVNVYILTNHNLFDNIIKNNIIKIKYLLKNISVLPDNIKENFVFIWNSKYIMKGDHIFVTDDVNGDVLISNTDIEYINIGILRKNNPNTFINIDNTSDLTKFRKHTKYNYLIK